MHQRVPSGRVAGSGKLMLSPLVSPTLHAADLLVPAVAVDQEAEDPCLPLGYRRAAPAGLVVGSGNFEQCRAIAKGLIAGQCQDELCPIGDSMPVELQGLLPAHAAVTCVM